MTNQDKYCPRCKTIFRCNVEQIQLCQCSEVYLSVQEITYIKNRYADCLCADCLMQMKVAYHDHTNLDKEE